MIDINELYAQVNEAALASVGVGALVGALFAFLRKIAF